MLGFLQSAMTQSSEEGRIFAEAALLSSPRRSEELKAVLGQVLTLPDGTLPTDARGNLLH